MKLPEIRRLAAVRLMRRMLGTEVGAAPDPEAPEIRSLVQEAGERILRPGDWVGAELRKWFQRR